MADRDRDLHLRVLGPLEVVVDGVAVGVGSEPRPALLSVLAALAGGPISVERLAREIWGVEPAPHLVGEVHRHLTDLRQVLGDRLEVTPTTCRLELADALDATAFTHEVARAEGVRQSRPADALAILDEALSRWRGEAFAGAGDSPTVADARERLHRLQTAATHSRFDLALSLGRHAGVIEELRTAAAADPADERLTQQLMVASYRSGLVSEAHAALARLADTLGTEPSEQTSQLASAIRRRDLALDLYPASVPVPRTRFIGRREDLALLGHALVGTRLLTLAGPGGAGKTSTASQLCREHMTEHPDGTFWVDLAATWDSGSVAARVALAVGVREAGDAPLDAAVAALGSGRGLVVLDNCEHLLAACREVVEAIQAGCPAVRVLATSRVPLHVQGETVWRLGGLTLPAAGATTTDALCSDALRLLAARAQDVRPGFALDPAEVPAAVEVCTQLDALPLAIEMAAARLRSMSLRELSTGLGSRLDLARPDGYGDRHSTMRTTITWSHGLLEPVERTLLHRLAVFRNGFTTQAALTVGAEPAGVRPHSAEEVHDALLRLVDHSLVVTTTDPDTTTRFHLLETVREFAHEHLSETTDLQSTQARHGRWAQTVAESSASFGGVDHEQSLGRVRAEQDNLMAALTWALEDDGAAEIALSIATSLWWYWWLSGQHTAGRHWLDRALTRTVAVPSVAHIAALRGCASLARSSDDLPAARHLG